MLTGGGEVRREVTISPYARYTLHVDDVPGLEQAEFSTLVESLTPLVAERAMYFIYNTRDGGSCSQGTTAPSTEWYLRGGLHRELSGDFQPRSHRWPDLEGEVIIV